MTLAAGTRLGPYEILALLGAGGMGEVYRARDTRLKREAAVKVLPVALSADRERLARFESEARAASALNHPNIVTIYDVGEAGGVAWIGMELVEGSTLRELLVEGSMPPRRAAALAAQLAGGLARAHEAGIVHRDFKPENVVVSPQGRAKILDFGLARVADSGAATLSHAPTAAELTRPGTVMGTVGYMSPEQVRGLAADHRTDIFALGAVLYEMVAGRRAFAAASPADVMTAILREDPPDLPPTTSPALARIVKRCLEKSPEERFQSARDLAFALESLSGSSGETTASKATPRRRPKAAVVLAALTTVAAAFAAGWLLRPALLRNEPPSFSRVVRLTWGPGQKFGPAISPDGKWVAYTSNVRGPVDVWVQFVAGGEPANLTASAGLQIQSRAEIGGLDISPDGTGIAVSVALPGQTAVDFTTWLIPAPLGGVARKLVEHGRGLRWSPDGRHLVYVRAGDSRGDSLWLADADGANERQIIKAQGGVHTHWPAFSPDGRFVYFIRGITTGNQEPSEIYRVSTAGGEAEPVVRTARRAVYPAPMPDGRGLLYAANAETANLALWWRPSNGSGARLLTTGVGDYAEPRVSPDGRLLVATLLDTRQSLASIPVRFEEALASRALTDGFHGDLDPALSPGGDRLVFSSTRSGNRNLWIAEPDGSQARPLTSGTSLDERPAFSPDGRSVAFVSDRGGERGIWIVSADGGSPRRLAAALVLDTLSFRPDGREILFSAPAGNFPGLWTASVSDGKVSRFPTPGGALAPVWSPRGDLVAYLEPLEGASPQPTVLRFVDTGGRPRFQDLPQSPGAGNGFVAWAPDGRRLAVVPVSGSVQTSIWIAEPGAKEPFRRLITMPPQSRLRGACFTADGSALLVGQEQVSSDIVLFTRDR